MTKRVRRADPYPRLPPAAQPVQIPPRLIEFMQHPPASLQQQLALGRHHHSLSRPVQQFA